jgi:LPS sulfotransferase NodH
MVGIKKLGTTALGISGDVLSLRRAGGRPAGVRFVIFGQGRTGSTLLETLLHSHPDIACEGELLAWKRLSPEGFLDRRSRGHQAAAWGCHVKPHHHARLVQGAEDLQRFAHSLHERGWLLIHLWRENTLEHVLSGYFARTTRSYRFTDQKAPPALKLTLDPERVVAKIARRQGLLEEERAALRGLPFHEVQYERDLKDPEGRLAAMKALQKRLGVRAMDLSTPLRKSVQKPFEEMVSNADEVLARLEASPFSRFADAAR